MYGYFVSEMNTTKQYNVAYFLLETKKSLFNIFSGIMVSTSANISGQKNLQKPEEIINFFEHDGMAYYDELLGTNKSPSRIIDLETKSVILA